MEVPEQGRRVAGWRDLGVQPVGGFGLLVAFHAGSVGGCSVSGVSFPSASNSRRSCLIRLAVLGSGSSTFTAARVGQRWATEYADADRWD